MNEFRDLNWDAEYKAIGRLVVEFERLVSALRFNCGCLFQTAGLSKWKMSENLLSAPLLSPEMLTLQFSVSIAELGGDTDIKKRAESLIAEVKHLAEQRNLIVHGEWLIGDDVVIITDSDEPGNTHGIKRKPSKKGPSVSELPTAEQMEALGDRCVAARQAVQKVFVDSVIQQHQSANPP